MKRVAVLVVLVLSLMAVHAATPPADAAALSAGCCYCPWYTISCQTNVQCDAYCGTPGWGVCEGFCCACLG